jgi:hypothetical protein
MCKYKENGAGGRTRTGTLLRAADFESAASTNFATPAGKCKLAKGAIIAILRQLTMADFTVVTEHKI